jgi:aminoglycoside phosphotransferase (APT) family kinase protein
MGQDNSISRDNIKGPNPSEEESNSTQVVKQEDLFRKKQETSGQIRQKFLMRLFDRHQYGKVKKLAQLLCILDDCQVPVPKPVDFGLCAQQQSVYLRTVWIDGESASAFLARVHAIDQYVLGYETALWLKVMHCCAAPVVNESWSILLAQETETLLRFCSSQKQCPDMILKLVGFVEKNKDGLVRKECCLLHGDLRPDNLLITSDQHILFVDFTKYCFGDPLYDLATAFCEISRISQPFATGLIDAYFNNDVTTRSFRDIALYGAIRFLRAYALSCESDLSPSRRQSCQGIQSFLDTYSNLRTVVPVWYKPTPRSL